MAMIAKNRTDDVCSRGETTGETLTRNSHRSVLASDPSRTTIKGPGPSDSSVLPGWNVKAFTPRRLYYASALPTPVRSAEMTLAARTKERIHHW